MNKQAIEEAIQTKSVIEFNYSNHHRVVEPHVMGIISGTTQVLCYQIDGSSGSGGIPDWRRLDLDRINNLVITNQRFPGRRPIPSGKHSSWDRVILVVGP